MSKLLFERPAWCRDETLWWLIQIPRLVIPSLCLLAALMGVVSGVMVKSASLGFGSAFLWCCIAFGAMWAIHFVAWAIVVSAEALLRKKQG